jgi:oligopeptide transport system permease protein
MNSRYLISRLVSSFVTLFIIASLTFFLLRLIPGGPFDGEKSFPPEIQANIEKRYGLHEPLPAQFVSWMKDLAQGDLRESFQHDGMPVQEIIAEALPVSFQLGGMATLISLLCGIPLGLWAGARHGSWVDRSILFFTAIGTSLPSYLFASLLILVFSLHFQWFPVALWEEPLSVVLPSLTLALRPLSLITQLMRASVLECLTTDWVRTALAKGLTESQVLFKHILRNSLIPLTSLLAPIVAGLLTGSFLVELTFQIPGLGKHFVSAVLNRDYPLVMGVTLTYGVILLTFTLAADFISAWFDPRIRLAATPETRKAAT